MGTKRGELFGERGCPCWDWSPGGRGLVHRYSGCHGEDPGHPSQHMQGASSAVPLSPSLKVKGNGGIRMEGAKRVDGRLDALPILSALSPAYPLSFLEAQAKSYTWHPVSASAQWPALGAPWGSHCRLQGLDASFRCHFKRLDTMAVIEGTADCAVTATLWGNRRLPCQGAVSHHSLNKRTPWRTQP